MNSSASSPAGHSSSSSWSDYVDPRKVGWLNLLLVLVPVVVALEWMHASHALIFVFSCAAILPLAGLMGTATEHLAARAGAGVGGLLNASFGNAAELIIALFALFSGHHELVKASLTGSIIGNILLVMGASLLAGGLKYSTQRFNKTAVGSGSTLAVLAAFGLLMPAIFHNLYGKGDANLDHKLSFATSVVLISGYLMSLLFSLVTHKDLFDVIDEESEGADHVAWSVTKSIVVLLIATIGVAWMAEILVGAVDKAGEQLGMTKIFMGVIVVAIVGNAAEHSTAILMAMKNKVDLALNIAVGSTLQIALFVAPVLVFVSAFSSHPLDLWFTTMEVAAVMIAVTIAWLISHDGESNWFEGAMLLMVYLILAIAFFFVPKYADSEGGEAPASAPAATATPGRAHR